MLPAPEFSSTVVNRVGRRNVVTKVNGDIAHDAGEWSTSGCSTSSCRCWVTRAALKIPSRLWNSGTPELPVHSLCLLLTPLRKAVAGVPLRSCCSRAVPSSVLPCCAAGRPWPAVSGGRSSSALGRRSRDRPTSPKFASGAIHLGLNAGRAARLHGSHIFVHPRHRSQSHRLRFHRQRMRRRLFGFCLNASSGCEYRDA